jgi:hypothetical protein
MTFCVNPEELISKARKMPLAYLEDCRALAIIREQDGFWCFSVANYDLLVRRYRGYATSEADRFREGEIISGCCDRADQY